MNELPNSLPAPRTPPGTIEDLLRYLLQGSAGVEYQHELRGPYTDMLRQRLLQSLLEKKPPTMMEQLFGGQRGKTAYDASNL